MIYWDTKPEVENAVQLAVLWLTDPDDLVALLNRRDNKNLAFFTEALEIFCEAIEKKSTFTKKLNVGVWGKDAHAAVLGVVRDRRLPNLHRLELLRDDEDEQHTYHEEAEALSQCIETGECSSLERLIVRLNLDESDREEVLSAVASGETPNLGLVNVCGSCDVAEEGTSTKDVERWKLLHLKTVKPSIPRPPICMLFWDDRREVENAVQLAVLWLTDPKDIVVLLNRRDNKNLSFFVDAMEIFCEAIENNATFTKKLNVGVWGRDAHRSVLRAIHEGRLRNLQRLELLRDDGDKGYSYHNEATALSQCIETRQCTSLEKLILRLDLDERDNGKVLAAVTSGATPNLELLNICGRCDLETEAKVIKAILDQKLPKLRTLHPFNLKAHQLILPLLPEEIAVKDNRAVLLFLCEQENDVPGTTAEIYNFERSVAGAGTEDSVHGASSTAELAQGHLDYFARRLERIPDRYEEDLKHQLLRAHSRDTTFRDIEESDAEVRCFEHDPFQWLCENFCDGKKRKEYVETVLAKTRITSTIANAVKAKLRDRVKENFPDFHSFYPKVIISYATGHRKGYDVDCAGPGLMVAVGVITLLFDKGHPCYSDIMTPAGRKWEEYMLRVDRAQVMIVLVCPAFLLSVHCLREVAEAIDRGVEIIPVRCAEKSINGSDIARDEESMWPDEVLQKYAELQNNPRSVLDELRLQRRAAVKKLTGTSTLPEYGTILNEPISIDELLKRVDELATRFRGRKNQHNTRIGLSKKD